MSLPDRTRPCLYIRALPEEGGAAVRMDIAKRVLSLTYEDSEEKADKLKLTLDNYDLSLFDDPAFRHGMLWEVSWGYPGNMSPTRVVVVKGAEGGTELTITAMAKSILLNTTEKTRSFSGMRRSEVVRQIAKEGGYGTDVQHIEDTKLVLPTIHQPGLTDAQFIRKLAKLEGFEFYVDFDGFHFHRRQLGQAPVRVLHYFTPPQVGEVLSFSLKNKVFGLPGRTKLKGRNPLERADFEVTADAKTDSERETLGSVLEVVNPEDGSTQLEQRIGSEETHASSSADAADAKRKAEGAFRKNQQAAIKLTVEMVGDPLMLAKTVVELRGISKRLSGRYYVKGVEHVVDSSGYKTKLEVVSDGHGGHSTESEVAKGLEMVDVGPAAGGRQNQKPPQPGAEGPAPEDAPLEVFEEVDPEKGGSRISYRNAAGRPPAGGG